MPRLNLYEQQTTAREARADSYAMGMAPAVALENFGNSLADIGNRVQKREELGVSQHVMENAEEMAQTALTDLGKRQDINSPKAMQDFEEAMQQIRQNGLMQFAGSADGRAALERQLDNQLAQYRKSAVATKIKAGQEQMGRVLDQQFNKSIMQVDVAPDVWSFARDEILDLVETWKPAMSKDQYEQAKRLAHAKPIQAAVRSYQAQGDYEAADKLMNDPENIQFMTVDELRPLRIDNAVGRGKIAKEQREIEGDRKAMSAILGYDVPKENVVPGFAKMPGVQKMRVWQMMNPGKVMPNDMRMRALGLERQESESLRNKVSSGASEYRYMTPEEQFKFRIDAQTLFPRKRVKDERGYITYESSMPVELSRLFDATTPGWREMDDSDPVATVPTPGAQPNELEYAKSLMRGQDGNVAIPEDSPFYDPSQPPPRPTKLVPPTRPEASITVDEMLYDVSGVGGAVGGIAARTPGIGPKIQELAPGAERASRYKARVTSGQNQIVALLQKNDKYPEGERKMIAEELAKVIRVWDNPASAARNLGAIDLSLADRQIMAEKIRDDKTVDRDVKQQALEMALMIKNYRKQLGVLRPKDEKEMEQLVNEGELYPGRNFWTPEGRRVTFTQEAYDQIIGNKKK